MKRELTGTVSIIISVIAVVFSLFHIYTGGVGLFPNIIQRAIHLGFALTICFAIYQPNKKADNTAIPFYDYILMAATVITSSYAVINYERFVLEPGYFTNLDIVCGVIFVALVFESARRTVGLFFPLLGIFLVIYALYGNHFPGAWSFRGLSFTRIFEIQYMTTEGVWGGITGVSAGVVAMFVIFGAIILFTGGGQTFFDFAIWSTGSKKGGGALVATVCSALFGTVSGSTAANAATTGAFTIPMMKRIGYKPEFAAAVEATASSGGQIMPPIMGAGAFMMAELVGVPYLSVIRAALVPAILFFLCVFMGIVFYAFREGLSPMPEDMIPSLRSFIVPSRSLPLVVPLVTVLYMILQGYSPVRAGFWSIILAILLFAITKIHSIDSFKSAAKDLFVALEGAGKSLVMVASLIACAQIIISIVTATGAAIKLSDIIISLSGDIYFLALFFAMITAIVLGMGIPTTAAYVLAASVLAPALIRMGIVPIAAHLYVFYFAIISAITPPVCAAVFIASGIAGSNWLSSAGYAMRLGLVAFIVPFLFIYHPPLLLEGSTTAITIAVISAIIGIIALQAGVFGYFIKNAT